VSKSPPLHAQRTVRKNRLAVEHAIATAPKFATSRKTTQGERARLALSMLKPFLPELRDAQRALEKAVGEAQNPPPDGAADGTLVDPEWSRYRDISDALRKLLEIA
jgi:hypothetical protein